MHSKAMQIALLFMIACVIAGAYGALHNQISYTVSKEYFTRFKFYQMRIVGRFPDRVGAALVGFLASWWMGLIIGVILIPVGAGQLNQEHLFRDMIHVFGIVVLTTFLVGIGALIVASLTINSGNVGQYERYGNLMTDNVAFARAGTMHNFSYLGGLLGIITGGITIWYKAR